MKKYKLINNVTGWLVFIAAAIVYALTIEDSVSFWDCGEFVPGAFKLEVVHPPGAPLFLMIGRMFTLFAGKDLTQVPIMVNLMSGIASAFAILFLFWTITMLAKKVIIGSSEDYSLPNIIAIMGAGVIGSACGIFADSFWFSAVEGEVYALSIGFLMLVVWMVFKWEQSESEYADLWLILISYTIGLSIGVHLLSLLAIQVLGIVYYYKNFKPTWKGFVLAASISFLSIFLLMKFVIGGIPSLAAFMDRFFVNSLHMPFNSGVIFFFVALAAIMAYALYYTKKQNHPIIYKFILASCFLLIGYSTYVMVPIRSAANPPINMNRPQDPYSLTGYINREQYGDRPLVYGPQYTADQYDLAEIKKTSYRYYKGKEGYEPVDQRVKYIWKDGVETLLPRMGFWQEEEKKNAYRGWLSRIGLEYNIVDRAKNNEVVATESSIEAANNRLAAMNKQAGQPRYTIKDNIGSYDNIIFLSRYQIGFMYMRYFLWNFVGRQNDDQGFYHNDDGKWITGINGLDKFFGSIFWGAPREDQSIVTKVKKDNWAHNVFYGIPFILGLLGVYYSYKKNQRIFLVILFFWLITGVLQIMYLNQPPVEPRERDYIFAGSVLAFCIWIAFGVLFIYDLLKDKLKGPAAPVVAVLICAAAPYLMGSQGWNDHDRSHRTVARDIAYDYLNSCQPNAVLFTQGDNDTYPLWYAQEVENIRPDVRIINLSLLGVDWYIDQLMRKMNDSEPLKLTFSYEKVKSRNRDVVRYRKSPLLNENDFYDAKKIMEFIASDRREDQTMEGDEMVNYLPTKKIRLMVDSATAVKQDMLAKEDWAEFVPQMDVTIPNNTLLKNDLLTLDLIISNINDRPIHFASSVAPSAYVGFGDYMQMEGLTQRVVPRRNPSGNGNGSPVRMDKEIVDKLLEFQYGHIADPKVYMSENDLRMTYNLRANFIRYARLMAQSNKKEEGNAILVKLMDGIPSNKVPLNFYSYQLPMAFYECGNKELGGKYGMELVNGFTDDLDYLSKLPAGSYSSDDVNRDIYLLQEVYKTMALNAAPEAAQVQQLLKQYADRFGFPLQQQALPQATPQAAPVNQEGAQPQ